MRTLNELTTFLTSKPGIVILRNETGLLEFEVDHVNGLSRKDMMSELYKYSGYKIKSTGTNTGKKQYLIFK